jgi:ribose/xylose/arabinose/galactoside ABC-type transport system permease subunit
VSTSHPENSTRPRALDYTGAALAIVGFMLFASVFVTTFANFGDFGDFASQAQSFGIRAVGGMVLLIVGSALRRHGALVRAGVDP